MRLTSTEVVMRPYFAQALSGEFRVRTDRLEQLRSLASLAADAVMAGEFQMQRQPLTKHDAAVFGVVLPHARIHTPEWTPATCVTFTESLGKQCLVGIELTNEQNEQTLAIYDATTDDENALIFVRDGQPWQLPLDGNHLARTRQQVTLTAQNFFNQL